MGSRPRYVMQHLPRPTATVPKDRPIYEKIGGGYTDDLQEAQVFGWGAPKKWGGPSNLRRLIPVTISP